jgi:hypothetical protein
MAHFAEIDIANTVTRVIVVHDSLEANGAQWCHDTLGGTWVQTSYNGRIRKNFAGIGFTYDPDLDAFVPPNPGYPSWTLDEQTCQWVPPVPMPHDGLYVWNEEQQEWVTP